MRREGSYIYEEFMPTGGTDVKVYLFSRILLFLKLFFIFLDGYSIVEYELSNLIETFHYRRFYCTKQK